MSKIVTVTFIAENDYINTESLRQHFLDEWKINASVSAHDYPDASEKSKWDRLDIPHADQARYFDPGCTDVCCNQAI